MQSWRTTEFADEHEDSVVTVMLEDTDEGALLTLVHSNVPDEQTSYEQVGWQQYYFEPMKAYFSGLGGKTVAKAKAAASKAKPRRATTKAAKTKRKPAPAAKAVSAKKKPKKTRAVAKAKRPARAKRKPSRGGRRR